MDFAFLERRIGNTAIILTVFFAMISHPLHAGTSHDCMIEGRTDRETGKVLHQYSAQCFYDDSGTLIYWVFSIQPRLPEPECRMPDESAGRHKTIGGTYGYESCEPIPEAQPPHTTAITGYPAIWKIQRSYSPGSYGFILENWSKKQEEIETTWRDQVFKTMSVNRSGPTPKLLPNRSSPFLPLFHRPADNFRGMSYFLPQGAVEHACEQADAPGCDYVDPSVQQWKYQECQNAGASGCDFWLTFTKFTLDEVIRSQFQSWVVRKSREMLDFPPLSIDYYPGGLNFETLRVPLYNASSTLAWYWDEFWRQCWAATSEGKSFDGCHAEFRDYILGLALEKASAKSYPTQRLAEQARLIAIAIDAARRFHEVTSEVLPDRKRWEGTGAEFTHLEPDELPPETIKKIRMAEHELTAAMAAVDAFREQ